MAELDLYGDLYGDVDDCGSPVALSPSQPVTTPAPEARPPSDGELRRNSGVNSPTLRNDPDSVSQPPTTFSISTYEDPKYSKNNLESPHRSGNEHWPSESAHPPRPSSAASNSSGGGANGGNRSAGMWGVKPSEMPDEGKMFVGGLNWETTEDVLKHYFAQYGSVVHCTIMRDPANGRSRGFAFLTFADPAVVNKVMVKEHFLDGKLIDPKRAIPRGTAPAPSGVPGSPMSDRRPSHNQSSESLSNKLFCRGMPENATPQSFRSYWAQFESQARIEEAVLMMERDSNRHRGFGFINLVTNEDADALLKCGPFVMDGHPLDVKRKSPTRGRDSRHDSRDHMNKMPPPLDRFGPPPHHDPYHHGPMGGFHKGGMGGGPGWRGAWNPGMLPPMGGGMGYNRGLYMGMGMHHDERSMLPNRGMAHDIPGSMLGPYGAPYQRSSSGSYGSDWRGGPPSMRSGVHGAYTSHHHPNPPPSVGPSRNQRGSRNYAPY
ncbi:hypothetical protein BY996DRAFT_4580594 [Phakopsora pachyrhizi]|uniref:RRM domain-containing protein n=1 Tax=Phakopsora pachyrhizi TaxID=170000 RepID=A0AAV0AUG0_PHAPC|nr:hypothetical protein BY996DRAFT_4580594 [Phakopsora pachyrhizi]CAH7672514.1 hypothetical protein PPACK8108_LOCUS7331 [Phakopsora pachyrhizi]